MKQKEKKKKQRSERIKKVTDKMKLIQAVLHCNLIDFLTTYAGQIPGRQVVVVEIVTKAYKWFSRQKEINKKDLRLEDLLQTQRNYAELMEFSSKARNLLVRASKGAGIPQKYYAKFRRTEKSKTKK